MHVEDKVVNVALFYWWDPDHTVQEKTTLWVHPLKNDNVGSAQQTLWVQNGGKWKSDQIRQTLRILNP